VRRAVTVLVVAAGLALAAPLSAQTPPASRITLSGVIQPQVNLVVRDGDTTDRVLLRRALVAVDVAAAPGWTARVQADFGPTTVDGQVLLRDAYLRYTGWAGHGLVLTIGNQKLPFSRIYGLPASQRGLIERPAPALRVYGTPGRTLSVRLDGRAAGPRLQWAASVASARHKPDVTQFRIDGDVEAASDWNEGVLTAGRVEWQPLGDMPRGQSDFGGPTRVVLAVGGYVWQNDGDTNFYTVDRRATSSTRADLDRARALETSAGFRGGRTSIDVEYHRVSGQAIDPHVQGGLYQDGEAHLQLVGIEGGVMLVPKRLEALAAFDSVRARAEDPRISGPSVGMNYYLSGHELKFSVMHRWVRNDDFVSGARSHATFVQAQLAF
jgi:hypothetical protein